MHLGTQGCKSEGTSRPALRALAAAIARASISACSFVTFCGTPRIPL